MDSETRCREIVYERSRGSCEVCGRTAQSVHHRRKDGRIWDPGNTLHLCGSGTTGCHGWVEAHPSHAARLGLWVERGADWTRTPIYVRPIQLWRDWWWANGDGTWTLDPEPGLAPALPVDVAAAVRALTTCRLVRR